MLNTVAFIFENDLPIKRGLVSLDFLLQLIFDLLHLKIPLNDV